SHIRSARVQICPILEGGGTRIKILESLAFGCPVVSTTVGAYGLPLDESCGLLRCDQPEPFAGACLQQLDPVTRSTAATARGRQYIREHYHPSVIERRLAQ